jgi:hypothetical protein
MAGRSGEIADEVSRVLHIAVTSAGYYPFIRAQNRPHHWAEPDSKSREPVPQRQETVIARP